MKTNGFLNGDMLLDDATIEELCSEVVRIIAQRDHNDILQPAVIR
ncbi:MAG: hypothetical protein OXH85_11465 [Truepera sp.]|nr:hypothetical protein [Truepera sp.]